LDQRVRVRIPEKRSCLLAMGWRWGGRYHADRPSLAVWPRPLQPRSGLSPAVTSLCQGSLPEVGGAEGARAGLVEAHVAVERARSLCTGEAARAAFDGVRPDAVERSRPLPAGVLDDDQGDRGAVGGGQGVPVLRAKSARRPAGRGGCWACDSDL